MFFQLLNNFNSCVPTKSDQRSSPNFIFQYYVLFFKESGVFVYILRVENRTAARTRSSGKEVFQWLHEVRRTRPSGFGTSFISHLASRNQIHFRTKLLEERKILANKNNKRHPVLMRQLQGNLPVNFVSANIELVIHSLLHLHKVLLQSRLPKL